jgi:hypothetical protein
MNPTLSAECDFAGMPLNRFNAAIFRQPAACDEPLLQLNALMQLSRRMRSMEDSRVFNQAGNAVDRMAIDPCCPCNLQSI